MSDSQLTDTSIDAYRELVDTGEDASLRRRVAAALADQPMTNAELIESFPDKSPNSVRPRVTELIRMGCVERGEKRTNPSGHEAYVHHVTATGYSYLEGRHTPEPGPTLAELKTDVVDVARAVIAGQANQDILHIAVNKHDQMKRRMKPDWEPDYEVALSTDGGRDE